MHTFLGVREPKKELFELSNIMEEGEKNHHPYIVFDGSRCIIESDIREVIKKYPNETVVLWQWEGKWSSDFFKVTVGDLAAHKIIQ